MTDQPVPRESYSEAIEDFLKAVYLLSKSTAACRPRNWPRRCDHRALENGNGEEAWRALSSSRTSRIVASA